MTSHVLFSFMQIRTKLSLYFTLISAALLLLVVIAINVLYAKHTREDFFTALKERAIVTAQVYLEADEISDSSLNRFKEKYLNTLPAEIIRVYDSADDPTFINDSGYRFGADTINYVRQTRYAEFLQGEKATVGIRYDDNQGSFVILVSALDKVGKAHQQTLLRSTLVIYSLELLILFFAGRWFAKQALLPVRNINDQMRRITATDLHLRMNEGRGKDEISELAVNFNSLLQRLETAFEGQRTFVANASHELRTPLTSMIGEIEVLNAQPRSLDECKDVLNSVLTEAEKLSNVINGLLQLAGAENSLSTQTVDDVRLDETLWDLQAQAEKHNQVLNVHLQSLPDDASRLCVKAAKHLLMLALSNVIRNAFKFSNNAAVDCWLNYTSDGLCLSVKDNGIGMAEEDKAKAFDAFYRAAAATPFEGHGLGLFMTKKIIELYGGSVAAQSVQGKGTTINIFFPAAQKF